MNICQAFAGKPLLIVNTASHCGYTPQFKGLEAAWQKYKSRGLVVVGFASDDFNQEDADEAKAAEICFLNNGVTFTMLAPMHVNGRGCEPGVPGAGSRQTEAPPLELQQVSGARRRQGAAAPRQQSRPGICRVRVCGGSTAEVVPGSVPVANSTLTLKRLGIDTYHEAVLYMNRNCHVCRSEGFVAQSRVQVTLGDRI